MSMLLTLAAIVLHLALILGAALLLPALGRCVVERRLVSPLAEARWLRLLLRKQATLPPSATLVTEIAPAAALALSAGAALLVPSAGGFVLPAGADLLILGALLITAELAALLGALDPGLAPAGAAAADRLAGLLPLLPCALLLAFGLGAGSGGTGLPAVLSALHDRPPAVLFAGTVALLLLLAARPPLTPVFAIGGADDAIYGIAGRLRLVAWLGLAALLLPGIPAPPGAAPAAILGAALVWAAKLAGLQLWWRLASPLAPAHRRGLGAAAVGVAALCVLLALPYRLA